MQPQTSHAVARALVLIDPLLSWNQAIASQTLAKWVIPGLFLLILALVVGRAWCGWVCPIGTTLDIFSSITKSHPTRKVPEKYRKIKYLLVIAIVIAAIGGSLTLLIFDPITLWLRIMTSGIWPVFNSAFSAGEELLAQVSWLTPAVVWLDQLARPAILPALTPGGSLCHAAYGAFPHPARAEPGSNPILVPLPLSA